MFLPSSKSALLFIASFAVLASAAKPLGFTSPYFDQTGPAGLPYFNLGQKVKISWTTPWENTTLVLYQKRSGSVFPQILAFGNGPENTTVTWTAAPINDHPVRGSQFHFFLQNSENPNCDTCYFNSQIFTLQPRAAGSSSSKPASTKTAATSTGGPSTSQSAAAAGSTSSPSKDSQSSDSGNIAIGVGIGVGVPVLIAILVILLLLARRRQKKQEAEVVAKSSGYSDATPPLTPQTQEHGDRTNRESGALGPYARNPTPTWSQQAAWEDERRRELGVVKPSSPLRQQQEWDAPPTPTRHPDRMTPPPRNPSRSSQNLDAFPFQPWSSTANEGTPASSRHSWLDNFDFEQPGYQNTDEMSAVRRSIHDATRDDPAHASASIVDVADIPQLLQSVQHSYADNWPLR